MHILRFRHGVTLPQPFAQHGLDIFTSDATTEATTASIVARQPPRRICSLGSTNSTPRTQMRVSLKLDLHSPYTKGELMPYLSRFVKMRHWSHRDDLLARREMSHTRDLLSHSSQECMARMVHGSVPPYSSPCRLRPLRSGAVLVLLPPLLGGLLLLQSWTTRKWHSALALCLRSVLSLHLMRMTTHDRLNVRASVVRKEHQVTTPALRRGHVKERKRLLNVHMYRAISLLVPPTHGR